MVHLKGLIFTKAGLALRDYFSCLLKAFFCVSLMASITIWGRRWQNMKQYNFFLTSLTSLPYITMATSKHSFNVIISGSLSVMVQMQYTYQILCQTFHVRKKYGQLNQNHGIKWQLILTQIVSYVTSIDSLVILSLFTFKRQISETLFLSASPSPNWAPMLYLSCRLSHANHMIITTL